MKVADAIIQSFIQEGVTTVFGYPGGAVLPLYQALAESPLRHILVRQEQAAAHAASGFARSLGTVGVCLATSGPGATNLITGIATAYMDSIPLVVITGQVRSDIIGRDVFQEADITGATEPFTKHNYLVKDPDQVPRILKEAFHIARTGRPGPVLIDLPIDVQDAQISVDWPKQVCIRGYKPTVTGHIGQLKRAWRRIKNSTRPLICAGGGVILGRAQEELRAFIDKTGIPLVHTLMGTGSLPTSHRLNLGMIGTHGQKTANRALYRADVLIVIGARAADRAMSNAAKLSDQTEIIHIDVDPAEIGKNLGAMIPVVGDAKTVLKQLLEVVEPADYSEWIAGLVSKQPDTNMQLPGRLMHPRLAIQALNEYLTDDAIVVADVGQNQMWTARGLDLREGQQFLTSGGLGTMGYALPAAIGAKVACPDRQVVCVVGDGGLQMSLAELAVIQQNNLQVTILLFNNSSLGMVRELQKKSGNHLFGIDLGHGPNFQLIAQAYGLRAWQVASCQELRAALQAAGDKQAAIVECLVEPDQPTL